MNMEGKRSMGEKNAVEEEYSMKKEAFRQYLHYFRVWFILAGCLLVCFALVAVRGLIKTGVPRANTSAPAERVYDYADVLTDQEEENLRELIARKEAGIQCDIVLVTVRETVETDYVSWETGMMNYADDFYDNHNYGYNKVHGDGVLLLDNWQEGQAGSWLSTCGAVLDRFGDYEIDEVLQAVGKDVESNPYKAYQSYIELVSRKMSSKISNYPPILILVAPLAVLVIFVLINMRSPLGKESVQANTYVVGGRANIRVQRDDFVRKFVTKRHIPRNDGGSGRSGGGGGHVSSGGVSHGGGGSRR